MQIGFDQQFWLKQSDFKDSIYMDTIDKKIF